MRREETIIFEKIVKFVLPSDSTDFQTIKVIPQNIVLSKNNFCVGPNCKKKRFYCFYTSRKLKKVDHSQIPRKSELTSFWLRENNKILRYLPS